MSRPRRAFGIAVAAGLVAVGGMAIPASTSAQENWEVVASGLDNPRHLAFSPGGALVRRRGRPRRLRALCRSPGGSSSASGSAAPSPGSATGRRSGSSPACHRFQRIRARPSALRPRLHGQAQVRAQRRARRQRRVPRRLRRRRRVAGDARRRKAAARARSPCSPTSWRTRRPPTLTAPTSTAIRSGCSVRGTATSSPMRAETPSCGWTRRAAVQHRSPRCRPTGRSAPTPCRRRSCGARTARSTSAS